MKIDRSKPGFTQSLMAKTLSYFMSSDGCVDPWRFCNPTGRQYSFYSHVRQTFSHIHYYFIDANLMPSVTDVAYHSIIISDHAPVSIDIKFSQGPRYPTQWRFNTLLLADGKFHEFITNVTDDFITLNHSNLNQVFFHYSYCFFLEH